MLGVEHDYEGLAYASYQRVPARRQHELRFHAPGRPKVRIAPEFRPGLPPTGPE